MSDVVETINKNIKTLEMLEKEYEKRATPRMKFASIRSALNNAVISLKKTKDRYSEELAKEPQECEWIPHIEVGRGYKCVSHYTTHCGVRRESMSPDVIYCDHCGRKIKVIEDD